jgi:hypothetical protein
VKPWLLIAGLAAGLAGIAWGSYTACGTGTFCGEGGEVEYRYHRFELGEHVLEIHIGERVSRCR